jgi:hypothetical protein
VLGGKALGRFEIRENYVEAAGAEILLEPGIARLQAPKIVAQNIVAHITRPVPHLRIIAAFDPLGTITLDTVNNIYITDSNIPWEAVLALLNSKLASWFAHRFIYNQAIRTMHFDGEYAGRLPWPELSASAIKECQTLVGHAMQARSEARNDFIQYDKQLDALIYKAFALESDEIELIESTTFHGAS